MRTRQGVFITIVTVLLLLELAVVRGQCACETPREIVTKGVYEAIYEGCGPSCDHEVVNIYGSYDGKFGRYIGIKTKGDDYVPTGEVSFILDDVKKTARTQRATFGFVHAIMDEQLYPFDVIHTYGIAADPAVEIVIHIPKSERCGPIRLRYLRNFNSSNDLTLEDMLLAAATSNKGKHA